MKRGKILIVLVLVSMFLVPLVSAGLVSDINDFFKDLFNMGDSDDINGEVGELASLSGEGSELIAHYSFEGNVNDVSGNGNDGINHGATFVGGKVGQAGSFDGNSYIDLGDDSDFELQDHTISMWVKKEANGEYLAMMGLQEQVSKTGGVSGSIFRFNNDNTLNYLVPKAGNKWTAVKTGDDFTSTNWTHILVTKDGAIVKIWVNGIMIKSKSVLSTMDFSTDSSKRTMIGAYWEGVKSKIVLPFKGKIDEVKIWNYALSEEEILEEYGEEECIPQCSGKECGYDECGGSCGSCSGGESCQSGVCVGEGELDIQISIATLKDIYGIGEKIKLT